MIDYRELENRLARNKEIIREREHDRLVERALGQREPKRWAWWVGLKVILSRALLQRVTPVESQANSCPAVTPRWQER